MKKHPSDQQLADLFESLRSVNLKQLERRLAAALERDRRGGSSRPDSMPTRASGAGGSGGGAELTAVESAANVLTFGKVRDPLHDEVVTAVRAVETATSNLYGAQNVLDRLAAQFEDRALVPVHCEPCKAAGLVHEADFFHTSAGGRLDREYDLCSAVYSLAIRTGELPDSDAIRQHARTGRWRQRIAA